MTPQAVTGLALAAVPTAVRCSRMFVRQCLRQWGLLSLADDSELVISELVTNAVNATGVTDAAPRWSQLAGLATIDVRIMLFERSIVIAVWDRSPAAPVPQKSGLHDSEDGRGLSIVAALSKRWDYFRHDQGGKCVWAELATQPDGLPPAGLGWPDCSQTVQNAEYCWLDPAVWRLSWNTDRPVLVRVLEGCVPPAKGLACVGRRAGSGRQYEPQTR